MIRQSVSSQNAITGGELFNVNNGVDGMAMESDSELTDMIRDIACNPAKYLEMGKKAKDFYDNNRTPKYMAEGLWNAVQFALEHC